VTRAQRAVLAQLTNDRAFVSAQDIHARLRRSGESVGLTSVYRALQALTDDGQLDARRTDGGEATYRRCGSDQHHHHLVCRQCGAAVEVEAPAVEKWVADLAATHRYVIDAHTLEIIGLCSRCADA
jgi:Fur family ferric uptake transcriptional regulator